jgi:hypothetical protein
MDLRDNQNLASVRRSKKGSVERLIFASDKSTSRSPREGFGGLG